MHNSIVIRVLSTYFIIIVATLLFTGFSFSKVSTNYIHEQQAKDLYSDSDKLKEFLKNYFDHEFSPIQKYSYNELEELLKDRISHLLKTVSNPFAILNNYQRPIYMSDSTQTQVYNFKSNIMPEISKSLSSNESSEFTMSIDNKEYNFFIVPIKSDISLDLQGGWIVIYTPSTADSLVNSLNNALILSFLFSIIFLVICGIWFANDITKPIIKLKTRAEMIAMRDFNYTVTIKSKNELGQLSVAIDKMALSLKEFDEAQRKFLQNASHELKTPLMSIQGYAEGLKDDVFEDKDLALDIIVEESTRLKKIVEDLIMLSKLETFDDYYSMHPISSVELIESCAKKVEGTLHNSNISMVLDLKDDSLILGDNNKLTQSIINILSNAIRYAHTNISIHGSKEYSRYKIVIYNDGDSFEMDEPNKIFSRFFKGKKGQTGLGLSITKIIIEKHRGTLTAENAPQGGVRFIITLPLQ